MSEPELRTIEANGIRLRVALQGEGPLVVLIHGWPESWYSWRHQIGPIAAAGFRVAAPDVRGYGGSDKPEAIEAYDMISLTADIAGLIEALGYDSAIVVGHDWGAPIAWQTSILHADKVSAVAGLSVPYTGRGQRPFIEVCRQIYKDRFFYQLYFQEPGVAEAELEADVRTALRKIYFMASGDAREQGLLIEKPADARLLDGLPDPDPLPAWLSEEELDYYTAQFEAGGFRGPLNRYRNSERDWETLPQLAEAKVTQPAAFIAGALDPVLSFIPGLDLVGLMQNTVADLRQVEIIDGVGHWVQQEAPDRVNEILLSFLSEVRS
tara:strand:- start:914 stop:1882 length:969 start_codon:yes stop_codon:yes gene_type:complete